MNTIPNDPPITDTTKRSNYGQGLSESAIRRRAERTRGQLGEPANGEVATTTDGRSYRRAVDGSLRRVSA